jgi:hypothetical protein
VSQNDQEAEKEFEEEVRTVARALWPSARSGGVENLDGVEHDGMFPAFDTIHFIEVTVSHRQDKAEWDGKKLKKAIDSWTGRDERLAKGWFITKDEPTTEQTKMIQKIDRRITAISFRRFKARLVDVYKYSLLRENMQFGSAQNPDSLDDLPEPYVQVGFNCIDAHGKSEEVSFEKSLECVREGQRLALIGDYGIGKSMNLREMYLRLTAAAKADRALNVPIHINLRNHWGQKSPSAAIIQHAEEIGYGNPEQLIAAWRAGFVHVLLDGFDEVAAPGWSGDLASLRSSRRRAVELVRRFVNETPKKAAVVVAGRRSYFDSLSELQDAVFSYNSHLLLELTEFNSKQINEYLRNKNANGIPDWLPARPLLLGHLAARNILQGDIKSETALMSQAESWDWLLDVVCNREAGIVEAGLNGATVREIIEILASQARRTGSGIGPLTQREITDAFLKLRGQEPSDSEQAILQRLPGLARDPNFEEGTRSFIDVDFASVAQARDVSNFAINPFSGLDERISNWSSSLSMLGIEVASHQYSATSTGIDKLSSSLKYATRKDLYVALADLVRISLTIGSSVNESILIDNTHIPSLTFFEGMPDISAVTFSRCLFDEVDFSDLIDETRLPSLQACSIESLLGRFGVSDLPMRVISEDCTFERFPDSPDRNAAVMSSSLPVGVRVIITILRKLYMQPGRGRLESALHRGMLTEEHGRVSTALVLLQREGMASSTRVQSRKIWLPNRSAQGRALRFIEAPRGSDDPLFAEASKL